jgi:type I restriction enzyme M protein
LGDFASVFNGPRFKRPFADQGVTGGPTIRPMFTPKAFFEERGESIKYLDLAKANPAQISQIEVLTLKTNWILIVDSGTAGKLLGRVGMTTAVHEETVGNNNLIRVVIDDPALRDYVYQFLRSELGQQLLLRNVYGTNQDHIEPDDVKDIPIPIPRDESEIEAIHARVRRLTELREETATLDTAIREQFTEIFDEAGLMLQRERKLRPDVIEIAFATVQAATGAGSKPIPPRQRESADATAVERGRKGGR